MCQDPGKIILLLLERLELSETTITADECRAYLAKYGTTQGLAIDAVSDLERGRIHLRRLSHDQVPAFVEYLATQQAEKGKAN